VAAHAIRDGERRPHSGQAGIVESFPDQGCIHLLKVNAHSIDELTGLLLVDSQSPFRCFEHQSYTGLDRQDAGAFPARHAAHSSGDDHPISKLLHFLRNLEPGNIGTDHIEGACDSHDRKMVLVLGADFADM